MKVVWSTPPSSGRDRRAPTGNTVLWTLMKSKKSCAAALRPPTAIRAASAPPSLHAASSLMTGRSRGRNIEADARAGSRERRPRPVPAIPAGLPPWRRSPTDSARAATRARLMRLPRALLELLHGFVDGREPCRGETRRPAPRCPLCPRAAAFLRETTAAARCGARLARQCEPAARLRRSQATHARRPRQRCRAHRRSKNDPRYAFMFDNANAGGDTMAEVISHLFRLPANGKPMTIMQLARLPCGSRRFRGVGAVPHGVRFLSPVERRRLARCCSSARKRIVTPQRVAISASARPRKAVSRIAKEGRKYGVYLGLVTQRPAELDATIISQCNTLFAMRLATTATRARRRSAVSDAAANLLSFVPSPGTRGSPGIRRRRALPTDACASRKCLHINCRARRAAIATVPSVAAGHDMNFVAAMLERWRGATLGPRCTERSWPKRASVLAAATAHGRYAASSALARPRPRPLPRC